MSNCKKFSVLAVDYIVPNDNGVIVVGSQITSAARTDNVTWKRLRDRARRGRHRQHWRCW